MRKFLVALIFLFSAGVVFAGDITGVSFTSEPRTAKPSETVQLTIQLQYSGDSHPTACMKMSSNSSTGQFSSSETNWNSVDKLTINSNWTNKNFYYKDSTIGSYILSIGIVPVSCSSLTDQEAQWTAEQNIVVSDGESDLPTPGVGESTQTTTVVDWPVEPQIYADAGADKTAVAGADIVFTGRALGLDKKPLESARYLWSFGDGANAEGKSVKHVYKYPGEYIAFLNVSSGEYSAGDGVSIKVIPNQLKIIEATGEFIKLKNNSSATLDITGWFLKNGNKIFQFPKTTLIKNGATLIIDSSISGINASDSKAELLYPNGSQAVFYANQGVSSPPTPLLQGEGSPQGGVRQKDPVEHSVFNISTTTGENQTTSAISSVQNKSENSNFGKWLAMASGVGVVSAVGLIFVRRKGLL